MDAIFLIQCLIIILALLYIWKSYTKKTTHYASDGQKLNPLPEPFSLPLVGHLQLLLKKDQHKYLAELSDTYGDIFQLKIGAKTVIVLNSLDVIREAFNEWPFTGRPNFTSFQTFNYGQYRRFAFMTLCPEWKFLRKNSVKALALFSSSRNSRLQKVTEEASRSLRDDIEANLNKPFDPKKSILECVAGVIGAVNFGTQFDRRDPMIDSLIQLTDAFASFIQVGTFLDYFPLGKFLMRNKIKQFLDVIEPLNLITDNYVNSHKYDQENVADVAEALYKRRAEITDEDLRKANVSSEEVQLISKELFSAGFATTMESLRWALTLAAAHPDVQEKIAQELNEQLEPGVHPTLEGVNKTPYTEAALLEVLRFSSLVPLGLPHSTVEACSFRGFYIPKDAIVLPNFWKVHREEKYFEQPYRFNPSRFIQTDGSLNTDLAQCIVPFSVGKRRCVGENLARQELYLLFSSIVQKFVIKPNSGETIDVDNAESGFTRRVKPYRLVFSLRS